MKMWSETGRQEVAKLQWLQGRKENWGALDGAEKMLQIDKGTDVPLPFKKFTSLTFNQYLSFSNTNSLHVPSKFSTLPIC